MKTAGIILFIAVSAAALLHYLRKFGSFGRWTVGKSIPILPYQEDDESGIHGVSQGGPTGTDPSGIFPCSDTR
jgi:hypothetical protein